LTIEEEDAIIHARITHDERPLRRVLKRFHGFASVACAPGQSSTDSAKVEDAREAFLIELATYQLALKKSSMVCEAETRQVDEYRRERQRIEQEHEVLKTQIEELKVALEHAQMLRRRKIEYDQVTEKVNTLPPRDELQREINALMNDMAAIRSEHETQDRTMLSQKAALDGIVAELSSLRFLGKDKDTTSAPNSPTPDAALALSDPVTESTLPEAPSTSSDLKDTMEKAEVTKILEEGGAEEGLLEEDIEMGEVEEEPSRSHAKKKARQEELEEGEASDQSSELSEPPDD